MSGNLYIGDIRSTVELILVIGSFDQDRVAYVHMLLFLADVTL